MKILFEIRNMITGKQSFALHLDCECGNVRDKISEIETFLGETTNDETKLIITREMRPDSVLEEFFKAHEAAHGGTWEQCSEVVWKFTEK